MANFPGYIFPGAAAPTADPNRTIALYSYDEDWRQDQAWGVLQTAVGGPYAFNLPINQQQNAKAGHVIPAYKEDYYHRIHVIPKLIQIGNLLTQREFDIEVWNAHLDPKSLSAITPTGNEGMALSEPVVAPTVFGPVESRDYHLTAYLAGPPIINTTYTFAFPDEAPVLTITGTRIQVWPFPPNWGRPFVERLSWLTDVMEAYDSTEQRVALRTAPRRSFEFQIMETGTDKRRLNATLWNWQARQFALPIFTDGGELTATASAGATSLPVVTTGLDYEVGGFAVLLVDAGTFEAVEISAVNPTSLDLNYGLQSDWPQGSRIYPARLAYLEDSQQIELRTSDVMEAALIFSLVNPSEYTPADSPATYRGYPILEEAPNWRDDITLEYKRKLAKLDNQTGLSNLDDESGRPTTYQAFLWTKLTRAAINALRGWLYAREGRLNPIWVESYEPDLELASNISAASVEIEVKASGLYSYHLQAAIGRRDIKIILKSGTKYYRRITGYVSLGATVDKLTIDSSLGQIVTTEDVHRISFLQLCRLDADAQAIRWHTTGVAEVRHNLRGLADDV